MLLIFYNICFITYHIFQTIRCTSPHQIWERNGGVSYSPNVAYLACWGGGGWWSRVFIPYFPPLKPRYILWSGASYSPKKMVLHPGGYCPIFAWYHLQFGPSTVPLNGHSIALSDGVVCFRTGRSHVYMPAIHLLFFKVGYLVQCNVRWDAM